jgi:hypothetical protein
LAAEGIVLVSTGINAKLNAVGVGVKGLDVKAEQALHSRYGSAIVVRDQKFPVPDACTIFACWPPKGGLEIRSASDGGACTSGFMAKRLDITRYGLFTAGHCISVHGGFGTNWKHNGTIIGPARYQSWISNATGDAGVVTVNSVPSTNRNYFFVSPNESLRGLTSVEDREAQYMDVCRTGRTSGKDCGIIVQVDVTLPSCVGTTCKNIQHQDEVDFDSTGGDSGGPVYYTFIGFGTHTHSDPDGDPDPHGWFTPLNWARYAYEVASGGERYYFCLSSSCGTVYP